MFTTQVGLRIAKAAWAATITGQGRMWLGPAATTYEADEKHLYALGEAWNLPRDHSPNPSCITVLGWEVPPPGLTGQPSLQLQPRGMETLGTKSQEVFWDYSDTGEPSPQHPIFNCSAQPRPAQLLRNRRNFRRRQDQAPTVGKHWNFNTQHNTRDTKGRAVTQSGTFHSPRTLTQLSAKYICVFPEYSVVRPSGVVLREVKR